MREICAACGVEEDKSVSSMFCPRCESDPKAQFWTKCATCDNKCPLKHCVPCRVQFKQNRRCQLCGIASDLQWCPDCFHTKTQNCEKCQRRCLRRFCDKCFNIAETCRGCGGKRRPGRALCKRCVTASSPWLNGLLQPFPMPFVLAPRSPAS
jgi:hypothetical protein